MSTENKELAIYVLHIHPEMGSALGTIDKDGHIVLMGNAREFLDGINRAKHIAHMHYAHQLGALIKQILVFVNIEITTLVHRNDTNGNTTLGGLQLPGHDIGMVLHHGDNHLVALVHKLLAERGCNEIETLGSATCEDNLIHRRGIDKTTNRLACSLVQVGSLL